MEKNHKNTDCYFFYYSTCTKGDNCAYRHESSALGSETVCQDWLEGSCLNQQCNFRHMEIRKNRKSIPCYWEKFPTGCKKPHCPFFHRMTRTAISNPIEPVKTVSAPTKPVNQEWSNRPDGKFEGNNTETEQGRGNSEAGSFIGSPVDPLIVNFEEESDSESAPSPTKNPRSRISSCKTYEEIRLEEIQAESAAFYFYGSATDYQGSVGGGKEKKVTSARSQRITVTSSVYGCESTERRGRESECDSKELDFRVLSLEEIRRRKKSRNPTDSASRGGGKEDGFLKDAIKVLDELRTANSESEAERASERWNKRNLVEAKSDESVKRSRTHGEGVRVPPVRLKRTRRTASPSKDREKLVDSRDDSEDDRTSERLEDASSSGRRQAVEVRLCDSSTDDSPSAEAPEGKSKSIVESQDNKNSTVCGDALTLGSREELHSLDTASDDILKDIDALLTDDPNS